MSACGTEIRWNTGPELVLLEQRDRRPTFGELERARRPDDPAAHHDDVRHVREPTGWTLP